MLTPRGFAQFYERLVTAVFTTACRICSIAAGMSPQGKSSLLVPKAASASVRPSRTGECRIASAEPLYPYVLFCTYLHTRPRVQRAPGIPCSLCLEGQRDAKLGQNGAVRMWTRICHLRLTGPLQRHCEERLRRSNPALSRKERIWIASLRPQ
jgi:hypothetical protein